VKDDVFIGANCGISKNARLKSGLSLHRAFFDGIDALSTMSYPNAVYRSTKERMYLREAVVVPGSRRIEAIPQKQRSFRLHADHY